MVRPASPPPVLSALPVVAVSLALAAGLAGAQDAVDLLPMETPPLGPVADDPLAIPRLDEDDTPRRSPYAGFDEPDEPGPDDEDAGLVGRTFDEVFDADPDDGESRPPSLVRQLADAAIGWGQGPDDPANLLPLQPSGIDDFGPPTLGVGRLRQGFTTQAFFTVRYDSNLFQSPSDLPPPPRPEPPPPPVIVVPPPAVAGPGGGVAAPPPPVVVPPPPPPEPVEQELTQQQRRRLGPQSDVILTPGVTLAYRGSREGSPWSMSASYSPSYTYYLDNDDLNGWNHDFGLNANYAGPKLRAGLSAGYTQGRGTNRYSQNFSEERRIGLGANLGYKVSPKTSLTASLGTSISEDIDESFGAAGQFNASLGGSYRASPLFSLGAGVRGNYEGRGRRGETSSREGRQSIGPYLTANYVLARRLAFTGNFGLNYQIYDEGDSRSDYRYGLGARYTLAQDWAFDVSASRSTQGNYSAASGFVTENSLRAGVSRRIGPAAARLGVGYRFDEFENAAGEESALRDSQDELTIDGSVGFPLWSERLTGSIFAQWRDNMSDDPAREWSGYQVGLSVTASF